MSLVKYPLSECIARPIGDDGTVFLLSDHLIGVAQAMGDPQGDNQEKINFLAGLLHDVGKARSEWQDYIRLTNQPKKGQPHSLVVSIMMV